MNTFDIAEDPYGDGYTTTGEYAFHIDGIALPSGGESCFYYKIADTEIPVKKNMVLQYQLRAENELGGHVFTDLVFDNGKKLSEINGADAMKAEKGVIGEWMTLTQTIPSSMVGSKIKSVIIAYDYAYPGQFDAYLDDMVIQVGEVSENELAQVIKEAQSLISGNRADYFTAASVKALSEAIKKANSASDKTAVKAAYNALINAMNALVAVPRKIPGEEPVAAPVTENQTPTDQNDRTAQTVTEEKTEKPSEEPTELSNAENTEPETQVKKVIKKVIKPAKQNNLLWIILIAAIITALALFAMMLFAAAKRKKEKET